MIGSWPACFGLKVQDNLIICLPKEKKNQHLIFKVVSVFKKCYFKNVYFIPHYECSLYLV